ncbi:D-alanyl-D-alanine carboxypeptidase family protein [Lachnoclostridium phytofermentans]|uniref:Serine-type D-Ala-D-Ala carboxypeptidase n=1 Tax=Lachnoclostridium phytofermentans (strain ATCC 700394 / DSM 18823 / ISDg) TaxID=357809 RepID=A9KLW7_LACP7|nr:D-alanyl-D-alanine carboxypeptidase family protein [Lachnoclostridium phytofermentans]ABX44276.1 Serine-type D-Ala-D-Ala carboxypeptidase [Lachnoclostridium phytofermentans ISDg]
MKVNLRKYFRRLLAFTVTVIITVSPATAYADTNTNKENVPSTVDVSDFTWPTGPEVYADAAIVMEASTGLILYEKDIYDKHYPASITKILTTLLAIENCNLNETMTMSHAAEWDVDFNSSRIGLVEGESLSLKDALYAVMLESANEVSFGVGEHVAKGSMTDFTAMMNARAKELGCVNSNFVNPNGLHDDNHYTCAYDMALISRAAIMLPEFRTITGTRTYTIPATNKNVARPLANHHRFIRKTSNYDGAIGGKTGGTTEAKTTLVTYAERNGLTLIAVVLHVDTGLHAYEDTAKILDFAFDNYALYRIEDTEGVNNSAFTSLFKDFPAFVKPDQSPLRLSSNSNVVLPVTADYKDAEKTITYTPVKEFVHGNNVIGQISYSYAGKYVGSTDILYYNQEYPLTKAEFDAQWPNYLIPPELIFKDSETNVTLGSESSDKEDIPVTSKTTKEKDSKKQGSSLVKPALLGIIATVIVLLVGYYILFIELPHRKRRRRYHENHKRRMDSMHRNYREDYIE